MWAPFVERYKDRDMNKGIKAYIEAELRYYHQSKKDLEEIREEIVESSPISDGTGIKGTSISDTVAKKAIRLITNKRLKRLEETIRAIDTVLDRLDEQKHKLIEMKYWRKPNYLNDAGIAHELHIDRTTLYRWKEAILLAIAIELGLIEDTNIKNA